MKIGTWDQFDPCHWGQKIRLKLSGHMGGTPVEKKVCVTMYNSLKMLHTNKLLKSVKQESHGGEKIMNINQNKNKNKKSEIQSLC